MKKILAFCLVLLSVACSKSNEVEQHEPPIFKSSVPENAATDVSIQTSIQVVFDEVVTLVQPHGITLNGNPANLTVNLTKLLFTDTLEQNTSYSVVIPKEALANTFGVTLQNDIQFSFTTQIIEPKDTIDPNEPFDLNIAAHLVTENPTPEAVNLYNFLKQNYGTKSISAVQANVAWNLNEAEWVNQHTGKYPAMATFDYIHLPYSPANWINYTNIDFIKDWWDNNGIVSASWHWLVAPTETETDQSKYVYTPKTTFKAANVPIEGTWENTVAKADLDKLIDYIKLLQDNNIPMIWRPFHEAAGNIYEYPNGKAWFWWGDDGAQAYKALWRFMFDYFKAQGVNNLIWVWTTQTKDDDFYPGDEYVDIIGRDIYNNANTADIAAQFATIQRTYPNKMVSLSECGSVSKVSAQWDSGAKWSYVMPWYDYERTNNVNEADFSKTDHEHANAAWWTDYMELDYVITRDQMPSLKQ